MPVNISIPPFPLLSVSKKREEKEEVKLRGLLRELFFSFLPPFVIETPQPTQISLSFPSYAIQLVVAFFLLSSIVVFVPFTAPLWQRGKTQT